MPMPKRLPLIVSTLLAGLLASPLSAAQGLDPADRDAQAAACTDFYQHANGGWLARSNVPAGRGTWGRFDQLIERSLQQQMELLNGLSPQAGGRDGMLATFWRSGMDEAGMDAQGAAPLAPMFQRIDGIRRARDVADTIAHLHAQGLPVAFNFGADVDLGDFGRTVAYATQGGLGLPDPVYYTREDRETRALLGRYRGHVERMLALSGVAADQVSTQAGWVLGIEMRMAQSSLGLVQLRDPYSTYKLQPMNTLTRRYGQLRLREFARAQGLGSLDTVSLGHEAFFDTLNSLVANVPVEQWQAYLRFHVTNAMARHLSADFRVAHFDFHGRLLAGRGEPLPRWQQVLQTMDETVGDALGQIYVEAHLSDSDRERAQAVVDAVRDALVAGVQQASWLDDAARTAATEKLNTLGIEVGVPRHWTDFSGLQLTGSSFAEHVLAAARYRHQQELARIGDTTELRWSVPTQVPNIGYDLALNRLTVSAALLQEPVLSSNGDAAVDFGALGTLAGQQLTHAVDDKGRTIDGTGRFNNWWSDEVRSRFQAMVAPLEVQYDGFNAMAGEMVSGRITRDGNVADLSGVELAWAGFDANHDTSTGSIDGLDPAQRFFHAYARVWQRVYTPQALRMRLSSEPQAPAKFRVNGPLMHQAAFAEAFSCPDDSAMRRSGDQRVVIWR